MWSTTPGAWARRERLLLTWLAMAVALVALAGPLHAAWLRLVGALVGVAGAFARAVIAGRVARIEREQEGVELDERLLVPIAPVEAIDPTRIGVDAASQTILAGGEVPAYQARDIDQDLRAAVAAAFDGSGRWLVVVTGRSKVGKSRALFEALRAVAGAHAELVAPVDGDAVRSLLTPGKQPRLRAEHTVLWLDDLEPFLNQGVTLRTLRAWRALANGAIVVATYGGKGSDRVAASSSQEVATLADTVLEQEAQRIALTASSPGELAQLPAGLAPQVREDLRRHGLAAFLVAAPKLEMKLNTARHGPGQRESPQGLAVVYAAVDWARCGRTDPITRETLRDLSRSYSAGPLATDEAFAGALDWALQPVAGSIALLQPVNTSYRPYDYVVRFESQRSAAPAPPDHAWAVALASAGDAQALAVGTTAYLVGRFDDALTAFATASGSPAAEVASIAGYNHGVTLAELGRSEEAVGVYEGVVARFGDAREAALREQVAKALFNKGGTLGVLGRSEEAVGVYEGVVARFGDAREAALRELVAKALFNKGVTLGVLGRSEEEVGVYEGVVARFGDAREAALREQVAMALFNKGVTLGVLGRSRGGGRGLRRGASRASATPPRRRCASRSPRRSSTRA